MLQSDTKPTTRPITGVVRHVDTINREVHVQAGEADLILDVPRDCAIFLHGERVRLRMIQPLDRVRATCQGGENPFVACVLEVQPE